MLHEHRSYFINIIKFISLNYFLIKYFKLIIPVSMVIPVSFLALKNINTTKIVYTYYFFTL